MIEDMWVYRQQIKNNIVRTKTFYLNFIVHISVNIKNMAK